MSNSTENSFELPCRHPYLKIHKLSGDKVCVCCGSAIYICQKKETPISLEQNDDIKWINKQVQGSC